MKNDLSFKSRFWVLLPILTVKFTTTSLRLNKIKFKEWLMILHGGKIYFVAYASLVLLQSIPPNQSPEYLGLSFLLSSEIIKTNFQTIFWCLQDMY